MATTRLSDIIVPEIFAPYMLEQSLEKNALVRSGFVAANPALSAALAAGGLTFNFPTMKHIDAGVAANVSSSDATVVAVPQKLSGVKQVAVRNERNIAFSSADLTAAVAGTDPMAAVGAELGDALTKVRSTVLRSTLAGVLAVVTSNVNSTSAAYSADALIDTTGAWGDKADDKPVVLLMNSKTHRMLKKAQATAFIPTAATPVGFGSYLGYPFLVDDKIADGAIYVIQAGGIEFGATQHANAVEVKREALQGNGGGVDILVARDIFTYHVPGMKWTGAAGIAGELPTDAELATAGNWALALDAKHVGVAKYVFTA